jgi:anaerobic magnesium-protoporphyrin IX monomethyl ester cyclase
MRRTAILVSTLGDWGGGDPLEQTFIAHGPAHLLSIGGDLIETRRNTLEGLADAVSGYDIIGVSATSACYPIARQVLEAIKDAPGKKVVGGIHASLRPEDYEGLADYIVQGHGETPWRMLLSGAEIPHLSRWETDDLDKLPFIDRQRWGPERAWLGLPAPFATVLAVRGCPYRCSFCYPAEFTHFGKIRRRSPEHLLAELQQLRDEKGVRGVQIHDDTFTYDLPWLEKFIEGAGRLHMQYFVGTRADHAVRHPDLFRRMRGVGVRALSVGFESGNNRILKILQKDIDVATNLAGAEVMHKYGYKIFANMMFGIPGETREEMEDTLRFIAAIRPVRVSPSIFSPYPGNLLGDQMRAEGKVVDTGVWRRDASRTYLPEHDPALLQEMIARAWAMSTEAGA